MPFPPEHVITFSDRGSDKLQDHICRLMSTLDIQWQYKSTIRQGIGFAAGNVWSRAARRSKENHPNRSNQEASMPQTGSGPSFGFKIKLQGLDNGSSLEVRWLMGLDSVLFESFCGMLRRKLTT